LALFHFISFDHEIRLRRALSRRYGYGLCAEHTCAFAIEDLFFIIYRVRAAEFVVMTGGGSRTRLVSRPPSIKQHIEVHVDEENAPSTEASRR
jgi:hypothetical protein